MDRGAGRAPAELPLPMEDAIALGRHRRAAPMHGTFGFTDR